MRRYANRASLAAFVASCALLLPLAGCSTGQVATTRYALVYGVSLYNSSYPEGRSAYGNLTYTDDDAAAFADSLTDLGWSGAEGYVKLRTAGSVGSTSPEPSKVTILSDLAGLAQSIGSGDTVLLYFSGHGQYMPSNKAYYMIPLNGISSSKALIAENCITPSELSAALAELPTNKVIVILDCCYSGGFVDAGSAVDTAPQNFEAELGSVEGSTIAAAFGEFGELLARNAVARDATPPIVISAAGSDELSWESSGAYSHGIFTYFLLSSWANGDANGDHYLTTTEAYDYIKSKIQATWNYSNGSTYAAADGVYMDFLPRISGGARDLVLFEM